MRLIFRTTMLVCGILLVFSTLCLGEERIRTGTVRVSVAIGVTKVTPAAVVLVPGAAAVHVQLEGSGLGAAGLQAIPVRSSGQPGAGVTATFAPPAGGTSRRLSLQAAAGTLPGEIKIRIEAGAARVDLPLVVTVKPIAAAVAPPAVAPRTRMGVAPPGGGPEKRPALVVSKTTPREVVLAAGGPVVSVTIEGAGLDTANLKVTFRPQGGMSGALEPARGGASRQMKLQAAAATMPGSFNVRLEAVGIVADIPLSLSVRPASSSVALKSGSLEASGSRVAAGRKSELGNKELSQEDFRAEVRKLETRGRTVPALERDLDALKSEAERDRTIKIQEANQRVMESAKTLAASAGGGMGIAERKRGEPRIDSIVDQQPFYSPGMAFVILGHSLWYSKEQAYGLVTFPDARVMARFAGKGGQERTVELNNSAGGLEPPPGTMVTGKFPDDLDGLMDQTAFIYATTPREGGGGWMKSNEVPIQFKAAREFKFVRHDEIEVVACSKASKNCEWDEQQWRQTGRWGENECNLSSLSSHYSGAPHLIQAYHGKNPCGDQGDVMHAGVDSYRIGLYNGHAIASIDVTHDCGGAQYYCDVQGYRNVLYEGGGAFIGAAIQYENFMHYGLQIVLEGPKGVSFNEAW